MRTCEHWQRIVIRTFVSRQYTSTRKTPILNPICELGERGSTGLKTRASHGYIGHFSSRDAGCTCTFQGISSSSPSPDARTLNMAITERICSGTLVRKCVEQARDGMTCSYGQSPTYAEHFFSFGKRNCLVA